MDLTDKFHLPPEQHHNWKYIRFGPDKKLYVPFGAPCNICEPPAGVRADPALQRRRLRHGGDRARRAQHRGFDWDPNTGELWFTDHGRDWMGDNGPQDELNRCRRSARTSGSRTATRRAWPTADFKKADACKDVTKPVALMGPHAAAMGVLFYTGSMFPAQYKDALFVARKGSWNRSKPFGFDVVNIKVGADGKNPKITPFMTGFIDGKDGKYDFWGRPAYSCRCPTARCSCPTSRRARSSA